MRLIAILQLEARYDNFLRRDLFIQSPQLKQGLNSGMQDSVSLPCGLYHQLI
jgi:hypothetical protein